MKKLTRRKGNVIQNNHSKESFKVFSISDTSQDMSFIGEYNSFEEAKQVVDKEDTSGISFYVYNNNSNRVLYEREKS